MAEIKAKPAKTAFKFDEHLILNRWLFSLFNKTQLAEFKGLLKDLEEGEYLNCDGQSYFYQRLSADPFVQGESLLTAQDLARYDLNIVNFWQKITVKRNRESGQILRPKYFQYLSLLFTEIYLDWYFHRPAQLVQELNLELAKYTKEASKTFTPREFQTFDSKDLNKIAFWNATGSGKTLLMHINILQYMHYFTATHKACDLNKIIILTPNEGLSHQHLVELKASGFACELFDKNLTAQSSFNFTSDEVGLDITVEIIDINKLNNKDGEKTVSVEAFEGNNLVLVDEGHRGTSGTEWLARREALIKDGFAFEYSATLGQAVAKGKTVADLILEKQKNLMKLKNLSELPQLSNLDIAKIRPQAVLETYAKSVLFDYSYKHFYADGYGKESLILNIQKEGFTEHLPLYFVANLLAFYQQCYLFHKHATAIKPWNIEKPLLVFVGNKVADDNSDILTVIKQLAFFVSQPQLVKTWLKDLITDEAQLLNNKNKHIFKGRFAPLAHFKTDIDGLYNDILQRVFNTSHSAELKLSHLTKSDGELSLKIGDHNPPFAVINIGDANGLLKIAQSTEKSIEYKNRKISCEFAGQKDEFSEALFREINSAKSTVNILIGSRKFTEGWSSWRVSTMGLLNMGKSEGSQIIQLFGRGVRLKGQNWSLKRSQAFERPKGVFLEKLETLNIFGINANYMDKFREYLANEDIQTSEDMLPFDFKVSHRLPEHHRLKTLQLKTEVKGNRPMSFKRQVKDIYLFEVPEQWQNKIKPIKVKLDYYPKVQSLASRGNAIRETYADNRYQATLNPTLWEFFDWDKIYLTISQYKHQQTWYNLRLEQNRLREFVENNSDWYELYIPQEAMRVDSFAKVEFQQQLLIDLLLMYTKAFYQACKSAYEGQFYEVVEVAEDNPSLLDSYQFNIPNNDAGKELIKRLEKLRNSLDTLNNSMQTIDGDSQNGLQMLCLNGHLYAPLFACLSNKDLPFTLTPLTINAESELKFVRDLMQAQNNGDLARWIGNKDLYLLRNFANKAKGLGFALAGNFYPDFLLWLVDKATVKQYLSLIDPKGIRNLDLEDAKFGLNQQLQELAQSLGIQNPILSSFILSITKRQELLNTSTKQIDFNQQHILFMEDPNYLANLFTLILENKNSK